MTRPGVTPRTSARPNRRRRDPAAVVWGTQPPPRFWRRQTRQPLRVPRFDTVASANREPARQVDDVDVERASAISRKAEIEESTES